MIEKILNWLDKQTGNTSKDYGFSTEWCALFVNIALTTHGYNKFKGASIYSCTAQMEYFKSINIWHDGEPITNAPCIIYYDWDKSGDCDHTGFMIDKTSNAYVTIEGNTMGDKWNNTSVNKLHRAIYSTTRLIRGYVNLHDIFNNEPYKPSNKPVYYGIGHITTDNTGKCQLLQKMLNVVNNAGLKTDGIIGTNTDRAIKDFQTKYSLEVDGVVGDETLFKLVQLYFNIPLENFNF